MIRATISGSFNKHWADVQAAVEKLKELGVQVLSPVDAPPAHQEKGFVYLRGDVGPPDAVEKRHLRAIQDSDFLYIVNPSGYLGNSVALEIGYAMAWHVPVWSSSPFQELPHELLVRVGTIPEACNEAKRRVEDPRLPLGGDVDELQSYVKEMAKARGFSDESAAEVFVLLVEEIGELAKAMRAHLKLSMSAADRSAKNIPLELADCFIYVLHFANQTGVNLLAAFREKERLNTRKKWVRGG